MTHIITAICIVMAVITGDRLIGVLAVTPADVKLVRYEPQNHSATA